jgi:ferrous iron transport protein A
MESTRLIELGSERSSGDLSLQSVLPLALAGEGERSRIISLGRGRGFHGKLMSMGLKVGDEIKVIHRRPGGAVLIAKDGARYAMGGGMAQKILVAVI